MGINFPNLLFADFAAPREEILAVQNPHLDFLFFSFSCFQA